ncbi:MAG: rhodanese-like domain-containing protein [Acidimicrobiia bacterium]|nr:rhodanese-like domain-containing protein [Acidimicrobiia bacterium]MDH5236845.1 rhodanese-like domain-containing protein [Acidimicrobiia bacterium]
MSDPTHRDHPVADYVTAIGEHGQLIDVREPTEVAAGTLPGAINIPLGELPQRLHELDRSRTVVLLCRSGGRSGKAAEFLVTEGFDDVVNLSGGMLAYAEHD